MSYGGEEKIVNTPIEKRIAENNYKISQRLRLYDLKSVENPKQETFCCNKYDDIMPGGCHDGLVFLVFLSDAILDK